jgi:hypothetical protein
MGLGAVIDDEEERGGGDVWGWWWGEKALFVARDERGQMRSPRPGVELVCVLRTMVLKEEFK